MNKRYNYKIKDIKDLEGVMALRLKNFLRMKEEALNNGDTLMAFTLEKRIEELEAVLYMVKE